MNVSARKLFGLLHRCLVLNKNVFANIIQCEIQEGGLSKLYNSSVNKPAWISRIFYDKSLIHQIIT